MGYINYDIELILEIYLIFDNIFFVIDLDFSKYYLLFLGWDLELVILGWFWCRTWFPVALCYFLFLSRMVITRKGNDLITLHVFFLRALCYYLGKLYTDITKLADYDDNIHDGYPSPPFRTAWDHGIINHHKSNLDLFLDWIGLCFALHIDLCTSLLDNLLGH